MGINMNLQLISAPAAEPMTSEQAAAVARLPSDADESDLLEGFVASARAHVESYLRLKLITQTWRLTVAKFSGSTLLPVWPVQSIDQVTYLDTAGERQTLAEATYRIVYSSGEAWLCPAREATWPEHLEDPDSVQVDVVAGFGGSGSDLPPDVLQGIRLLVAHYIEHREAVVTGTIATDLPLGVQSLLSPHRRWV